MTETPMDQQESSAEIAAAADALPDSADAMEAGSAVQSDAASTPVAEAEPAEHAADDADSELYRDARKVPPAAPRMRDIQFGRDVSLNQIIEGALLAAAEPLSLKKLASLFESEDQDDQTPTTAELCEALEQIAEACEGRGFELKQTGSGWRFQVRQQTAPWVNRLWEEKPQKYSRALLETLALIAYRQPITRGDIEEIRGVAVSSHIIKTLTEREWIKVVGHRDVPGRPSLYATTRQFLDYFNLKSLEELPTLGELRDLDELGAQIEPELGLDAEPSEGESSPLLAQENTQELAANTGASEPEDLQQQMPDDYLHSILESASADEAGEEDADETVENAALETEPVEEGAAESESVETALAEVESADTESHAEEPAEEPVEAGCDEAESAASTELESPRELSQLEQNQADSSTYKSLFGADKD